MSKMPKRPTLDEVENSDSWRAAFVWIFTHPVVVFLSLALGVLNLLILWYQSR